MNDGSILEQKGEIMGCSDNKKAYLEEYSSSDSVTKYVTKTAGKGIQYNLTHHYGPIYSEIIDTICSERGKVKPFRVLEYGCGAGMNLLWIFKMLLSKKLTVSSAIGVDFSKPLIDAAEKEKEALPKGYDLTKIKFLLASNESLLEDLSKNLPEDKNTLRNGFDLVVGVNTFRYAVREGTQNDCATNIASLLAPGGYTVMIDMNNKFPLFRSWFRDRITKPRSRYLIPSLEEYAAPFTTSGLKIVQKRNFCWTPHSANTVLLFVTNHLSPLLQTIVPSFSMRSLIIAKKKC